jgi:hypothetical protein
MGIKEDRARMYFRATKEEEAKINRLIKASGLSQQEWILSTLLAGATQAPSNNQELIKGIEAKRMLAMGQLGRLYSDDEIAFIGDALYLVAKSANGNQSQLLKLFNFDDQMWAAFFGTRDFNPRCDLKLDGLTKAIPRWLELKELLAGFPDCDRILRRGAKFDDLETFEDLKEKALKAIEEHKASIAQPKSHIEVAKDVNPIEATKEAPTPVKEPTIEVDAPMAKLTRAEFEAIYHFSANADYLMVLNKARGGVWVSPTDGKAWTVEGFKNKTRWEYLPLFNTLEQPKLDTVGV